MKSGKTLIIIAAISLISGSYRSIAQTAEELLPKGIQLEEVKGELGKAIEVYQTILTQFSANRPIASKALIHIGLCNEKLGNAEARKAYERVVRDYPDQTEMVALAKTKLTQLTGAVSESTLKAEQSFKLAGDLYKQFKYESAITEYKKVIQLSPKSRLAEESRLWIGQCYFKAGKYDRALASYKSILKEYPQSTIVPVTELMISQLKLAIAQTPKKSNIITVDDKTILDPETGIRYTKINTWAGKYDVINSAASITDIAPNRKFLLADNRVIPFENGDVFHLTDTTSSVWTTSSRLSPDASEIAFFKYKELSVIPVSPETGHPTGSVKKLIEKSTEYHSIYSTLNWSPDGKNLVFTFFEGNYQANLWTYSMTDGSANQVTNLNGPIFNPVFSKNGLNIFYKYQPNGEGNYSVMMSPGEKGEPVTILDSCWYKDRFILSPDNRWIVYDKTSDSHQYLLRLVDRQKWKLPSPEEVGEFVSWADEGGKVFFYRTSYEAQNLIKVASVFGGPVFECGKQFGKWPLGWSPDSKGLLFLEKDYQGNSNIKIISLANQDSKTIEGIENPSAFPSFSPDGSKILMGISWPGKQADLSVLPFSLKEHKVTGKPVVVYKAHNDGIYRCSWSPDSRRIVVHHGGEVWICQAVGGPPLQLTKTVRIERVPLWSPDGTTIAVGVDSTLQLRIIRVSDGEILRTIEKVLGFDWTPGGKDILIASTDGLLSATSIASGSSRSIANWKEIGSSVSGLKGSPDGKWIALVGMYDKGKTVQTHINLINVSSGNYTEVAKDDPGNKAYLIWSPDSKWITYCHIMAPLSDGSKKIRPEGTLWEADLTDFMKKK